MKQETPSISIPQLRNANDLKARMGEALLNSRLAKQAKHEARLTHQGEGIFKLERSRHISIDRLAEKALRLSLLWRRAHQNIFKIRTVEQAWQLPNLPPAFDGFRLLQLSDLHLDIDPNLASVIARSVRKCPHDAMVVTGDFRKTTSDDLEPSMALMPQILEATKAPCYGVLGNHDFIQKVERLESYGMRILLNESTPLKRDGEKLWIAGVDDPHFYRTHDFAAARSGMPEDACSVLLCHSPEPYSEAAEYGFDLMLSGHTHGGQICLPGGRHLVNSSKGLPRRFVRGRWQSGSMLGYTSPGTGSSGVAARLNCPPEITVHTLACQR
ncbi:metallophosphoesterase [Coraliomargarita sinensis]|uniref:Metallophosphoesterase n=1 Tax=Coraliomargarita sinensis TaxID=2174842 RepID=A0A317ZJY2_9BACT|nr:metallophosphoesterase [Coraliomargarita sinensis]PXA05312.1 metallophosphoesterase [Coraliomargarita sinensis]